MTEKEAIRNINALNAVCGQKDFYDEEFEKALGMAIKALEKQIPKKVIPRHIRKYDGFDDGECPTCRNSVLRDGFSNDIYCDECGQKLDWE